MKNPTISIITPSYNQSQFLDKTIRSVLSQDYPEIEYMVVDGGSTDGSPEIIRSFEKQLAWWVSEKDNGQADAVNKGFSKASGKYIGWLNSDDLYLPGTISKAVNLLEAHPEAGFVFGDVQSIDEVGNITNIMRYGNWQLSDLMQFKIIGQPGVFMRKEIMDRIGGLDISYQYLLDHKLWLKMGLEAGMVYSGQVWAAARFHASAKNVAQAALFGEEAYRLVSWMENEPRFQRLWAQNNRKIHAGAHRMNARYLLDGDQPKDALKAYINGICSHFMTVIPEWHRMVYAVLSILGLKNIKKIYYKLKFWLLRPDKQEH